jgi:hypothetical protein
MDWMWTTVAFVVWLLVLSWPAFEMARRRAVARPALAFIPVAGPWMATLAAVGQTMWLALLILVPYVGALGLGIWLAVVVPQRHARNQWWTFGFLVPVVNIVAFYWYAFTLEPSPTPVSPQALDRPAPLVTREGREEEGQRLHDFMDP